MPERVDVIGAGLAGSEAAWQLARAGVRVRLLEMKPAERTEAHRSGLFAELVCSNSLRSDRLTNAVGLLKAEMEKLDSLVMAAARKTAVPAGGALAVDREAFAGAVTEAIRSHPLIEVEQRRVGSLEEWMGGKPVIIAAGPLCAGNLATSIQQVAGSDFLSFYDAVSPIVTAESVDMDRAFWASRYGRGSDYLNCPMDREQYLAFHRELVGAERAPMRGFETMSVFEGCMPIETMAERGVDTMRFGPMKPRGLSAPGWDRPPYAVAQLRRENLEGTLLGLVGFQTRLRFGEQKRVFSMIPGLENAEFTRYGVMHRNTFLRAPGVLDDRFRLVKLPSMRFAGQITGVEGYVESAASGLLAGLFAARETLAQSVPSFGTDTALGALCRHVSSCPSDSYQPSNITFGMMDPLDERIRSKEERNARIAMRALDAIDGIKAAHGLGTAQ